MTSSDRTSIDIVGGGVAGLALAALLDPKSWTVRLHEGDPDQHQLPTCFGIWPFARRALREIGLDELVESHAAIARGGSLLSERGTVLGSSTRVEIPLVTRPGLLAWLDSKVPGTVERNHRRIEDPGALPGTLVVGADGAHSEIRRRQFGGTARRTGYQALRGVVPRETINGAEIWGKGLQFGYTPHPDGMTNWFATNREFSADTERREPVGAALERARAEFADFPSPVADILASATEERSLVNGIIEAPTLRSFTRGRYVLIGDSAHAMSPNLGRGACESLLDAAVLASALNRIDPGDARARATALGSYDAKRCRPSQRIRRASRLMQRLSVQQTAWRDRPMALFGRLAR